MTYCLPATPRTRPDHGPAAHVYTYFLLVDADGAAYGGSPDSAEVSSWLDKHGHGGWAKLGVTTTGERVKLRYIARAW